MPSVLSTRTRRDVIRTLSCVTFALIVSFLDPHEPAGLLIILAAGLLVLVIQYIDAG